MILMSIGQAASWADLRLVMANYAFLVAWFHCECAESSNGRHFIRVVFLWDDTITNLTHCLTENQIFAVQSLINRIYIYARYLRRK